MNEFERHGDDIYKYSDIKSNFSSNICSHPDSSLRGLMDHLASMPSLLSHYPEPEAWSLERMIAERLDIDPRCVVVTSGAIDALYLIARVLGPASVIPCPTFDEYERACSFTGNRVYRSSSMNTLAQEGDTLWLCNPNNPTGKVLTQSEVRHLRRQFRDLIIDQSYARYTDIPVMPAQEAIRLRHIVLIHSMSKDYCVPGLRLGYLITAPQMANCFRRYMRPWAVSGPAIEAGKYLLQHDELLAQPDLREAQRLRQRIEQIEGVSVAPTRTNFMLCKLKNGKGCDLKEYLVREHKMLIRDGATFYGLSAPYFRVAAQTPAENDALVEAIRQFVNMNN